MFITWSVIVDQSVEQSLPAPEVRSSNLAIGKFIRCQLNWKEI